MVGGALAIDKLSVSAEGTKERAEKDSYSSRLLRLRN